MTANLLKALLIGIYKGFIRKTEILTFFLSFDPSKVVFRQSSLKTTLEGENYTNLVVIVNNVQKDILDQKLYHISKMV